MNLHVWWRKLLERVLPARKLQVLHGDGFPSTMPRRALILVRDDGEDWCVGFRCPCGCSQRVELPLIQEATPRWTLKLESDGTPSLSPSVWLRDGCRSHFFVRHGKVRWVGIARGR
jgi:Family of unknown function (DUF6527)